MQNKNMPQFGAHNHSQSMDMFRPVRPNGYNQGPAMGGNSEPSFNFEPDFGPKNQVTQPVQSMQPMMSKQKKPGFFTTLSREQVLTGLTVIFGILALVFLVTTIAIAVKKPETAVQERPQVQSISLSEMESTTLGFFTKKIENPTENAIYKLNADVYNSDDQAVVSALIIVSNNGIDFTVNWEFAKDYYKLNSSRVDVEMFPIATTQPIADVTIGRASKYVTDDVLLILMADGTIEYMPIRAALEGYAIKDYGKLGEIKDVVKFYHAQETVKETEDSSLEYTDTVLAQQTDGTIIDLRELLLKAVGKDLK